MWRRKCDGRLGTKVGCREEKQARGGMKGQYAGEENSQESTHERDYSWGLKKAGTPVRDTR